jgi:hypothetical protein
VQLQFQYHDLVAVFVVLTHEHEVLEVLFMHEEVCWLLVVLPPVVVFVNKLFVTQQLYDVPEALQDVLVKLRFL